MKEFTLVKDKETKNKDRYQIRDGDVNIGSLYLPKGSTPPVEVRLTVVDPE